MSVGLNLNKYYIILLYYYVDFCDWNMSDLQQN